MITLKEVLTKEEREALEYVNQQSYYRTELILELQKLCKIDNNDLSVQLDICYDTLLRYENYKRKLPMEVFIMACYFFGKYMKKHGIKCTPRILELISVTSLFENFV